MANEEKPAPVRLQILPPEFAGTRGVLSPTDTTFTPIAGGEPNAPDLVCGKCGYKLVEKKSRRSIADEVKNGAIQCPQCGSINDLATFDAN